MDFKKLIHKRHFSGNEVSFYLKRGLFKEFPVTKRLGVVQKNLHEGFTVS